MDELLLQLRKICRSIARGKHDYVKQLEALTLEGKHPKEISDLAESFSLMLVKLEIREHRLQEALEELKSKNDSLRKKIHTLEINIDQIKKKRAVVDVAQSKFFKDIQKKAKERRKKE
jgi:methyl-accepting chemotaxis protein